MEKDSDGWLITSTNSGMNSGKNQFRKNKRYFRNSFKQHTRTIEYKKIIFKKPSEKTDLTYRQLDTVTIQYNI